MLTGSLPARNARRNRVRIVADELVWMETGGDGPPDVLVPSEYAPALALDLRLAQHRLRIAAAPFALEDRIAQPIGDTHVVVGRSIGPRRYLAAAVSKARLEEWRSLLAANGVTPRRLIPDAMLLPVPAGGEAWAVQVEAGRVLIRTSGQEAYGTSLEMFDALWSAAGRPSLWQVGAGDLQGHVFAGHVGPDPVASDRSIDLLQGLKPNGKAAYGRVLSVAAMLLVAAGTAHTAILAMDTAFVGNGVERRRVEARNVLAELAPLAQPAADPALTLESVLAYGGQGARQSRFLPLFSRIATAVQPAPPGLVLQALSYDEPEGSLLLEMEAGDLAALEQVEERLRGAGLSARSDGASVRDGGAESSILVRDGTDGTEFAP